MADYVRRGRRMADQAGRRVLAPVVAVRRQRDDLVQAQNELHEVRQELNSAREELSQVKDQLRVARAARDTRRATEFVEQIMQQVRAEQLTFLTPAALRDLALVARDLEANHMTGLVIEAGTAAGGSAIVLAAAKSANRPMKVYDVFGPMPEPGEPDDKNGPLYDEVTQSFVRLGVTPGEHGVELVKGLFQDTITVNEPVALAHLDADWYESTMTCLERLAPLLVSGGRIVLDDYDSSTGCRDAVDAYFRDRHMDFRFEQHNRLHVVRR
jgi:hypothetical protein